MATKRDSEVAELRDRVLYTMLLPATRMARLLDRPLKSLREWMQMSYFHEWKRQGLKLHEIAERMDISQRKVAMLSKQLKENFSIHEQEASVPRRIEFMLWAGPLSSARIKQTLSGVDSKNVDRALRRLLKDGRIEEKQLERMVVYGVVSSESRLVTPQWKSRLDALEELLSTVIQTVHLRFFEEENRAFARTLSFRMRREDYERLVEMYQDDIWTIIKELDSRAKDTTDDENLEEFSLTVCWSPHDRTE